MSSPNDEIEPSPSRGASAPGTVIDAPTADTPVEATAGSSTGPTAPRNGNGGGNGNENGTLTRKESRERASRRKKRWITFGVLALVAALLVPVGANYVHDLRAPGTDSMGARTVEWMREHGFGPMVNQIERWWYTKNAPPKGGTPEGGLPTAQAPTSAAVGRIPTDLALLVGSVKQTLLPTTTPPKAMQPFVDTPLPGEGAWEATGRTVLGTPAVYTAFMRPDPIHTSLVAGFMWMDPKLLKAVHVPGLKEPAGAPQKYGAQIPNELRPSTVAAFNSAFRLDDARGGFWDEGTEVRPLVPGQATLTIDKDGRADVVAWGRDRNIDADLAQARQNLALVVDNGVSAAGLDSEATTKWGATVGNQVLVWRSGIGVDRNGGLIYIAGPGLSVNQLAELFLRAGAVRAMELDINSDWTTAYIFEQTDPNNAAAIIGNKLLPDMKRGGDRYLVPGERDFVTMVARY
ncbi:MAG: phosphodiester glycosidase family protein [Acidimicrobiia bacterium]